MKRNKVYCRYCGKTIDEDASFCTYCGKKQNVTKVSSWSFCKLLIRINTIGLKLLALIRIPFDYAKKINMPRMNAEKIDFWCKRLKRVGKVLLILLIIGGIVATSLWGYYEEYIPRKICADILSKMHSDDDSIRLLYNYKILVLHEQLGYDNVSDNEIKNRLSSHRKEAFQYIENEAYKNKAFAQYCLGLLYINKNNYLYSQDTTKAVYWWNEAVKHDYIPAYYKLGVAYENGWGVERNLRKAVDFFRKGAEKGEPRAQTSYGRLFRDGVIIKVGSHKETRTTHDYKSDRIREYWDNKREQTMYVYMVDVDDFEELIPQNIEKAKYWWHKAAAQGDESAKELLQKIYE